MSLTVDQQSLSYRIVRRIARLFGYGFISTYDFGSTWSSTLVEANFVWPFMIHINEYGDWCVSNLAGFRVTMRSLEIGYRRDAIILAMRIRDHLTVDECRSIAYCTSVMKLSVDTRMTITGEMKRFREMLEATNEHGKAN